MFRQIFVPTDGSELSRRAVELALGLAKPLGATIHTLCVKQPFPYTATADPQPAPPPEFFAAQDEAAGRHVQEVLDACRAAGIEAQAATVDAAQPWEAIVAHATAAGCDLLVMGSHGRSGLAALLLGSETEDVIKHTTIPVLVVR